MSNKTKNILGEYLSKTKRVKQNTAMLAYVANLTKVAEVVPNIARSIVQELADQRSNLKLIASENYSSLSTQLAMGNLLTDKYAEGFPGHRFYAGCDNIDDIEAFASEQACKLFGAEHAYVQPHSGADANVVAFWAILNARVQTPYLKKLGEENPVKLSKSDWEDLRAQLGNQKLLGMDMFSGGHLTHTYRWNVSSKMFDAYSYTVKKETGVLDYDELEKMALEIKPLIFLVGYSAYPRHIDFKRMRQIADKAGAVLMVDMAHFAGLVAGKVFSGVHNPVAYAHVVTTTTHKTLRGPRGGMILCTKEFAEHVDKGCPLILGGPLPQMMAAKAVAFTEDCKPAFRAYAKKIVTNAKALAAACTKEGIVVATGGTDNHLILVDVRPFGLTGRQAESSVRECNLTLNRNSLPFDTQGPWYTSGLRLGTPAVTTLGMGPKEMIEIAAILKLILVHTKAVIATSGKDKGQMSKAHFVTDPRAKTEAKKRVAILLKRFPVYPELDLVFLQKHFS